MTLQRGFVWTGFSLDVSHTIKSLVCPVTVIVNLRWFKGVQLKRQLSLQTHWVLYEDCSDSRPQKEKSLAKRGQCSRNITIPDRFFHSLSVPISSDISMRATNSSEAQIAVIHHQPKRTQESFPFEEHLRVDGGERYDK